MNSVKSSNYQIQSVDRNQQRAEKRQYYNPGIDNEWAKKRNFSSTHVNPGLEVGYQESVTEIHKAPNTMEAQNDLFANGAWTSDNGHVSDDILRVVSYDNQSFEEEDFEADMQQKDHAPKIMRVMSETFPY